MGGSRVAAEGYRRTLHEIPQITIRTRILIGDIAHSLAAALDHVVYQLSLSHQIRIGTPDAVAVCDAHKTHFPISKSIDNGAGKVINKRLKLMAQGPADFIRDIQPYKRTEADPRLDPIADPLWILFRLDIIDKHRVVLAASQSVKLGRITVSAPEQDPQIIEMPDATWQPLEHGNKLFSLSLPITEWPNPGVDFHADATLVILFTETGQWCDGKPVVPLLRLLIDYIERRVIARLATFL